MKAMDNNNHELAERIAGFLRQGEGETSDFALLRKSVEQISERLLKIENSLFTNDAPHGVRSSSPIHPSREKFEIAEAFSMQEIYDDADAEKPCPFEPTGKPCDHCSMCSSRGF